MDKKNIQALLQDELEKEIPSSEIHLWQTVKARLVENPNQQGAIMKTTKSRLAYATLAIAAVLALAFVTPQGRASRKVCSNSSPAPIKTATRFKTGR